MIKIHNICSNFTKIFKTQKENNKNFFLFANRKNSVFDDKLKEDEIFLNSNSISVFFNTAQPIIQSKFIADHPLKWIFYRCLAKNEKYGTFFRDLELLERFYFDRYFFIPDFFDPKYRSKNFFIPTIDYLISKNIDTSKIGHLTLFDPTELSRVKELYDKTKTPSTGFWIYLYLRGLYPKSIITLVGYNSVIDPIYHDASFEKAYLLSHIQNKLCRSISCFDAA
jgi:hypothetical protein